jgi:hypothetical protein
LDGSSLTWATMGMIFSSISTLVSSVTLILFPTGAHTKKADLSFHDCLPPDAAEARRWGSARHVQQAVLKIARFSPCILS